MSCFNASFFSTNAFILCDLVLKTAIIFGRLWVFQVIERCSGKCRTHSADFGQTWRWIRRSTVYHSWTCWSYHVCRRIQGKASWSCEGVFRRKGLAYLVALISFLFTYIGRTWISRLKDLEFQFASPTFPIPTYCWREEKSLPLVKLQSSRSRERVSECRVIHSPGHSEGSMCYFVKRPGAEDAMVSGDVLFANSVGRTE